MQKAVFRSFFTLLHSLWAASSPETVNCTEPGLSPHTETLQIFAFWILWSRLSWWWSANIRDINLPVTKLLSKVKWPSDHCTCTSLSSCFWQSFSFFRVLSIMTTARALSFFLLSSSCCAFIAALTMFRSILSSSCSLSSFLMQYL